jgi:cytochrome c553
MNKTLAISAVLALTSPTLRAADLAAGKALVESVCAACHGANGVSVSDTIPNLAAQKSAYLEAQLRALKDGARKNPMMNAMAAQLSAADVENVAAFFASQPGAATGARSAQLPNVAKSNVPFPEGYGDSFVKYLTINFPATKQVRYFLANKVALEAAKAGKPLPDGSFLFAEIYAAKLDAAGKPVTGGDGFYVPGKQIGYSAMASGKGWGDAIPGMLRNGNWNYAVFTLDKKPRAINQAECFACHKPHDKESFLFTLKELAAAK